MTRFGIGTDIESVSRFADLLGKNDPLIQRVFTSGEIRYSLASQRPAERFAARFAGKEAVVKALYDLGITGVAIPAVEVCKRPDGAPFVRVIGLPADRVQVRISLSHTREWAIAYALAIDDAET